MRPLMNASAPRAEEEDDPGHRRCRAVSGVDSPEQQEHDEHEGDVHGEGDRDVRQIGTQAEGREQPAVDQDRDRLPVAAVRA